jgi:hypothetical protein
MKLVQLFQTEDGKTFSNRDEAKAHEANLQGIKELSILLAGTVKTGRVEAVLQHLLMESTEVSAILNRHRKRLPKLPKVVAKAA